MPTLDTVFEICPRGLLGFLDTWDATLLRQCSTLAREVVAEFPWEDKATRITGSLHQWRTCYPNARAANISARGDLRDEDFSHLRGVHTLDMSNCSQSTITDAAFAHLRGIHTLNMSVCTQSTITDAAFAHLCGIDTLIRE